MLVFRIKRTEKIMMVDNGLDLRVKVLENQKSEIRLHRCRHDLSTLVRLKALRFVITVKNLDIHNTHVQLKRISHMLRKTKIDDAIK
jgi:hypothetical protein